MPRRRTPIEQLKARGSWRWKTRAQEAGPAPRPGTPDCPDRLSPAARAAWGELVAVLRARDTLSPDYRAALSILAVNIAFAGEFYRRMQEAGADGRDLRRLQTLHNRFSADVLKWLRAFGLTPADSVRLGKHPSVESSPSAPRSAPAVISRRGCAGLVGKNRRLQMEKTDDENPER